MTKKKEKKEKTEDIKVEESVAADSPKRYFVSDPEKADRSFDLGVLGLVHLVFGTFETEVTKEQAEALKAYSYLEIKEV